MTDKKINIGEAVNAGWRIATKNWLFFVGVLFVILLINWGEGFIMSMVTSKKQVVADIMVFVLDVAFYAVNILIALGIIKIALNFLKNNTAKFSDLFSQSNLILKSFVVGLLIALFTVLPILIPLGLFGITMLFPLSIAINITRVVLGVLGIVGVFFSVYFALRFMYSQYFLIDKNSGITDSLKLSSEATRGVKWQLIGFGFVSLGIVILGFIALLVGLFVAIPVAILANAAIYLQLTGQSVSAATAPMAMKTPEMPSGPTA